MCVYVHQQKGEQIATDLPADPIYGLRIADTPILAFFPICLDGRQFLKSVIFSFSLETGCTRKATRF